MGGRELVIPYAPRACFLPFHQRTQRWACIVAHRRAGKTVATLNDLIKRAITEGKDGRYAYVAPYWAQAKAVAWDYLLKYTEPIRKAANVTELQVELLNGSRIRLYGADNPDSLRGISLSGALLDEVANMRPRVWGEILRPALADRQGWAVFIGTPAGHNAFYDIWQKAQKEAGWYAAMVKASTSGILPAAELADARASMTDDQYAQEFECSFDAAILGAIYGKELEAARSDGRVTAVPHDPALRVDTWWDLGVGDSTSIVFTQTHGQQVRVIDYYEASGEGLPHYARILDSKGYLYGTHNAPHDIEVRELGSGKSRLETARGLGITFRVVPNIGLEDGINAARLLFPRCVFDADKAWPLLESLGRYRWEINERMSEPGKPLFKPRPVHDAASHAADAFRYLAVGHKVEAKAKAIKYPNLGLA